ncbi:MAG TPA: hypothetical protein VLK82_28040 [Candidatus Tectomicrobia bacterium]|nr:hypothetical protein [Candidatus Tectomicrobia bacterium]
MACYPGLVHNAYFMPMGQTAPAIQSFHGTLQGKPRRWSGPATERFLVPLRQAGLKREG